MADLDKSPTQPFDLEYEGPTIGWVKVYGPPGGTVPEAPTDGQQYGRQNAAWTVITGGGGGGGGSEGVPTFATPGDAQGATIPDSIGNLSTTGNRTPGDGGASTFKRVNGLQSKFVGDGVVIPNVPPSFSSGGVPVCCFATTWRTVQGVYDNYVFQTREPVLPGCLTFVTIFWTAVTTGEFPTNVTDGAGNVYAPAIQVDAGGFGIFALYYNANPVFAPTGTIFTVAGFNPAVSGNQIILNIYCCPTFKGAVLDQTATHLGVVPADTGISVTSPPLTGSPSLVIGAVFSGQSVVLNGATPGMAYNVPAGWVDLQPPIYGKDPIACTVVNSTSPVTFNPTWASGAAPTGANAFIITFKGFPTTTLDPSYWQQNPSWPYHLAQFGIDPATADNATPFQNFAKYLATITPPSGGLGVERTGTPSPSALITISIANPAVITISSIDPRIDHHRLFGGMPVSFTTTGTLPAPIVAGQLYYVVYGSVTPSTFKISTTPLFTGIGQTNTAPAALSTLGGSQSGTHSLVTYGESWTDFVWDPGSYAASNNTPPGINAGLQKVRMLAHGARIATNMNITGTADRDPNAATGGTQFAFHTQFQTTKVFDSGHSKNFVTLVDPTKLSNFHVNSWVMLMGIDMQLSAGANFNNYYFEFLKVKALDVDGSITSPYGAPGSVVFYDTLQYQYRSTWPKLNNAAIVSGSVVAGPWSPGASGPGTIVQLSDLFEQEIEVHGLNWYAVTEGTIGGLLSVRLVDCVFYGWGFSSGPSPANIRNFTMERCVFHRCTPEVDKMIDTIQYIDCVFDEISFPRFQSASINKILIERCKLMGSLPAIQGSGKDLTIKDSFLVGDLQLGAPYGCTDRVTLINSTVQAVTDGQQQGTVVGTNQVTFSNGTIKVADGATTPYGTWHQPGGGTPGQCPLPWAVPGGKVYIAMSPQITTAGSVGTQATSGMIKAFTILDVYVDGAGAFCADTDMVSFPSTARTVTATVSTAAGVSSLNVTALTQADGNILIGDSVTGGTLPGGVVVTDNAPGLPGSGIQSYKLNGNYGTIGSGTFTITTPTILCPHPAPRFNVIGCTGGRQVTDWAGAPPDIPIYSYFRRTITGLPNALSTPEVKTRLCGNLVSLTIDVRRAYTGAAGSFLFTISLMGFKTASGVTYPTALSETVNLKTVGVRTILPGSTSGGVAGDILAAIPFWITGNQQFSVGPTLGGGDTLAMMPYFIVTAQTDQGITSSMTISATHGIDEFADSNINASAIW